nr:hypothetical protein [Tanacetum cinerariifolium]
MWKAIERLKQGESINVQDLKTNLYWEFRKFTSQDGELLKSYYLRFYKMMNELIRNQCKVTNHQVNVQFLLQLQPEWQRIPQPRGKVIVNSPQPIYDQEPSMVDDDDDETSKDKEIDKLMALISLSFKKIYKPTNNNLQTSSNTSCVNQDNSPRINRNAGYESQRSGNVAGARETVVSSMNKLIGKMILMMNLMIKNWKHIICTWLKFKRFLQMLLTLDLSLTLSQHKSKQIDQNDEDAELAKERELLVSLIKKLKCEIDESKNRNKFLETSNKKSQAELKRRDSIEYASKMELECAKNTIEQNFCPVISRINAGLDLFLKRLNEEMVVDLGYFNSFDFEVDSLTSQLETQKTYFVNEIYRLSREYYYANHMNAILGVYTELDEVTNLQCDYLELLQKCKCLEIGLLKSKMMSKSFESVQKHAINLELELQQCKEKIKNDMSFKVNKSKDFCKEREQYFEIQDLKAQLQDKGIVISELKKLIEKMKENLWTLSLKNHRLFDNQMLLKVRDHQF